MFLFKILLYKQRQQRAQRGGPKRQLPHATEQQQSMTMVGGVWKIGEWSERKVCPGFSVESQHDQLRWRGWMRPFTGSNERVPAGPWMRVGPSAPHRRAQTSDLENYPGSTLGQSPQQQAGVHTATGRFNQCLAASSTEQSFFFAFKELCVKSTPRDTSHGVLKGWSCQWLSHVKTSRSSHHLWEVWDDALRTLPLNTRSVCLSYLWTCTAFLHMGVG